LESDNPNGAQHKNRLASGTSAKDQHDINPLPFKAIAALFIGLGFGVVAAMLFASQTDHALQACGSALIFSTAAAISGGAIGFLFGVPKSERRPAQSDLSTQGTERQPTDYQFNTNLEQISDWLTKIIVGVALTQLGTIRGGASDLFNAMAPALGGGASGAAVAGGLTVYFSVYGFLMGWLAASLVLPHHLDGLEHHRRMRRLQETCCHTRPVSVDEVRPIPAGGDPNELTRVAT
jgi:hypothetical protein